MNLWRLYLTTKWFSVISNFPFYSFFQNSSKNYLTIPRNSFTEFSRKLMVHCTRRMLVFSGTISRLCENIFTMAGSIWMKLPKVSLPHYIKKCFRLVYFLIFDFDPKWFWINLKSFRIFITFRDCLFLKQIAGRH